jgi:hypothetical protein
MLPQGDVVMDLADLRMMVQYEGGAQHACACMLRGCGLSACVCLCLCYVSYVLSFNHPYLCVLCAVCCVLCAADYSPQHRVVRLFWRMLEQDFSELERRALLLFWTGSSVPPCGGFSMDAEYDEVVDVDYPPPPRSIQPTLPPTFACWR